MPNKKLIVSFIITVVYAIITLIAVLHHEIWTDEAQVWMMCKHLSLFELFLHLHNEGHPSLFYLILMPFAKISGNIIYQQIICQLFMCAAVFFLLYKTAFNMFVKISILLSSGFLYFLPIMARNYALIPFFVIWAAILYPNRKEKPVLYSIPLFFLTNTHAVMFGFTAILFLFFTVEIIKDKENLKQKITAACVMLFGLLLFIAQLYDLTSSNIFITLHSDKILFNIIKVPLFFFLNAAGTPGNLIIPAIIFAVFILLFITLYKNSKKLFYVCFFGILFQFFIYIFFYDSFQRVTRIFCAFIIFVFCYAVLFAENKLSDKNGKISGILLSALFLLTSYNGINSYAEDFLYNYSSAKSTAEYIKNNVPKNSLIIAVNEIYSEALAYYLDDDYIFLSHLRNKPFKYIVWDNINYSAPEPEIIYGLCELYKTEYSEIYIIIPIFVKEYHDKLLKELIDKKLSLEYTSEHSMDIYERYYVYKYTPDKNIK